MEDEMRTTLTTVCYAAVAFGFMAILYTGAQNGLM
jgi:hypothetical protein